MKLVLQWSDTNLPPGSGVTSRPGEESLGDDSTGDMVSGYDTQAQVSLQEVQFPGADEVTLINRGNRRWKSSWTTDRVWADADTAAAFIDPHIQRITDATNATLIKTIGAKTTKAAAVVESAHTRLDGSLTTVTIYTVSHGDFA